MPYEREIEVGAADGDLRLWAAREAQRQGEVTLAAQTANLVAAETRATSLVGWTVAGVLAGLAVIAGHPTSHTHCILAIMGAPVFVSMGACVSALWPKAWHWPGFDLAWLMKHGPDDCELNNLEAMAAAYQKGIQENDRSLKKFARKMKIAWIGFFCIPAAAVSVVLLFG